MVQGVALIMALAAAGSPAPGEVRAFQVCEGVILRTASIADGAQVPRIPARRYQADGHTFEWRPGDGLKFVRLSGELQEVRARCDTAADGTVAGLVVDGRTLIARPLSDEERIVQQRIDAALRAMQAQGEGPHDAAATTR